MKIGVISDVHGNAEALKAVMKDLKEQNVDQVIILGDIALKGNEPQACYDLLKSLNSIVWIKGNTEDWFNQIDEDFTPESEMEKRIYSEFQYTLENLTPEAINDLKSMPESEVVEIDEKSILCVHGSDEELHGQLGIMTPEHEMKALINRMEEDILLCGHTHWPYTASFAGKIIINAGSVGLPKDDFGASYAVLEFYEKQFSYGIRRIEY